MVGNFTSVYGCEGFLLVQGTCTVRRTIPARACRGTSDRITACPAGSSLGGRLLGIATYRERY
jgi:hypothetical protein